MYDITHDLLISNVRLTNYKDINEYIANVKYSQKLYPLLSFFEIGLRNKVNNFYISEFGNDWLVGGVIANKYMVEQIEEAKERVISDGKLIVGNGDLIGRLTLGFWVSLFDTGYLISSKLQVKQTKYVFGISPKNIDSKYSKLLHRELNYIREARNRIFHYEKILGHPTYKNLELLLNKYLYRIDNKNYLANLLKNNFTVEIIPPKRL